MEEEKIEKIMEIALKRAFFWPTAEFYSDRQAGFYDYGPYGVMLKNNIINLWRKIFLSEEENIIEIDGSQILPESVFIASGHLQHFTDPLVGCPRCNFKARADKLIEEKVKKQISEKLPLSEYDKLIQKYKIKCPKCGSSLKKTENWNMMLRTEIGVDFKKCYLRPETCQSIFASFPRIYRTMRVKLPFGIAQVGKSFRNEVSPRQGLVRLREFTQAEIEIFFNPERDICMEKVKEEILPLYIENKILKIKCGEAVKKKIISCNLIAYYLALLKNFSIKAGLPEEKIRFRYVDKEKPFYAKETWDFECLTSLGWLELCACNHRGDYDLIRHQKVSGKSFEIVDETTNKKIIPNIFELSLGIDRLVLALLDTNYKEDAQNERVLFTFKPYIAPIFVAVFPLVKKGGMSEIAKQIYHELKKDFSCFYDDSGSIGRRYRRQDEIGTPFCITIDSQTLQDNTVTIRERDSMQQIRVSKEKIKEELKDYKL